MGTLGLREGILFVPAQRLSKLPDISLSPLASRPKLECYITGASQTAGVRGGFF